MLRYLILLIPIILISCNDGDIIVTNFDFEGQEINLCRTAQVNQPGNIKYVFSKINDETQEALAIEFITDEPILTETTDGTPYTITLNGTDALVSYRIFDGEVTESYFCNAIPPSSPGVTEEYVSAEGTVVITVTGDRSDDDGIPDAAEFTLNGEEDLDGDGLPNIYDFDDDGDNIPTSGEGAAITTNDEIDMENSEDSDGDGIPDFMDPDDDNDGVLTRNEDANRDNNPGNDRSGTVDLLDYLNDDIAVDHAVNQYIVHAYDLENIEVTIVLNNLVFRNTSTEDVIRREQLLYETYQAASQNDTITPQFSE